MALIYDPPVDESPRRASGEVTRRRPSRRAYGRRSRPELTPQTPAVSAAPRAAQPGTRPPTPRAPQPTREDGGGLLGALGSLARNIESFFSDVARNDPFIEGTGVEPGYFLGKMREDVAETVQGLKALPELVRRRGYAGAAADIGRGVVGEAAEFIRDPVDYVWRYANEDPLLFTLDVLGLGAGASHLAGRVKALRAAGLLDLASERGAIGPFGRLLEEAREVERLTPLEATYMYSPEARIGGETAKAWAKRASAVSQGREEYIANLILSQADPPFKFPGVGRFRNPDPDWPLEYAVIEDIPGLRHINDPEDILPEFQQQYRGIAITDAALGNTDRLIGHNLVALDESLEPIGFDYGIAFSSSPQYAKGPGVRFFSEADIDFTPDEIAYLERLHKVVRDLFENRGPYAYDPWLNFNELQRAISNIELLLDKPYFWEVPSLWDPLPHTFRRFNLAGRQGVWHYLY